MKERPILFNCEMVKAILEGRKTQTRRVMRRQPDAVERFKQGKETTDTEAKYAILRCYKNPKGFKKCNSGWFADATYKTPFSEFNVGDRLWVRETFCYAWNEDDHICDKDGNPVWDAKDAHIYYAASETNVDGKWKPSIHMPRWASRILLEITNIRVERLNDISEVDAIAEGVEPIIIQDNIPVDGGWTRADLHLWKGYKNKERAFRETAKDSFTSLWQEINGTDSWTVNPWVWVVEFKIIQGGAA